MLMCDKGALPCIFLGTQSFTRPTDGFSACMRRTKAINASAHATKLKTESGRWYSTSGGGKAVPGNAVTRTTSTARSDIMFGSGPSAAEQKQLSVRK